MHVSLARQQIAPIQIALVPRGFESQHVNLQGMGGQESLRTQ